MKNIIILGSTGSIGVSALKVIKQHPEKYRVVALSAARNIGLLLRQIKEFKPVAVSVLDESLAERLKTKLGKGPAPDIFFGKNGYKQIATMEGTDTVISAMTGAAGLIPTFEAIQSGKNIALANKETMVMAGGLVMDEAKKRGVSILPVDSEHSAILQSLQGHPREDLKRIILTASGGPFRNLSLDEMRKMTAAQALNNPNWDMGPKITIDSATLMNKGLEVIEAKWLFDLPIEKIGVLVHPQSIIHSMAEYIDGSIIAQLGVPDMTIPISYALSYPHHLRNHLSALDLLTAGDLQFQKPDMSRFRCLALALEAAKTGGTMPAVLNGSNEIAVDAFLKGQIGFLDIPALIEKTMRTHNISSVDNIAAVVEADGWARRETKEHLENLVGPLHG